MSEFGTGQGARRDGTDRRCASAFPWNLHKQIGMCLYAVVSARTKAFEAAGELLKVLAAPARLAIVTELADQPGSCTSWSTCSG